jgi:hypothetical protein
MHLGYSRGAIITPTFMYEPFPQWMCFKINLICFTCSAQNPETCGSGKLSDPSCLCSEFDSWSRDWFETGDDERKNRVDRESPESLKMDQKTT